MKIIGTIATAPTLDNAGKEVAKASSFETATGLPEGMTPNQVTNAVHQAVSNLLNLASSVGQSPKSLTVEVA